MKRNGKSSKSTKCPNCKKFGLVRYHSGNTGELKVRCKKCYSFWIDTKAKQLSDLIDVNSIKMIHGKL